MTEIQHLTAFHYVSYAEKHHGKQKYFFIQDRNKNTQPLHQGNFIVTFSQHLIGVIVIQIKARAFYNMQCHFVSVILFAHSLTSVISLNPSLQHPCLPVSLVYLSVVPSFTSSPDCLPYPCLPSSPPPLFCACYSVMYGFTPCTPPSCFQVFPLTCCTSVIILFSNSPTCITPPPLYTTTPSSFFSPSRILCL